MTLRRPWTSLTRIAFLACCATCVAAPAAAQPAEPRGQGLAAALEPGTIAWITLSGEPERRARVIGLSNDLLTISTGSDIRRVDAAQVVRVRARRSDPLWNGALFGAGAAVASGLFLCTLTESWDNCRDDAGPMLSIGAIGAGGGIGIDALIRGRRTIYEAGRGQTAFQVVPFVAPRASGLLVSVSLLPPAR